MPALNHIGQKYKNKPQTFIPRSSKSCEKWKKKNKNMKLGHFQMDQQRQERFPPATRSLLARVPLMYWQAGPCGLSVTPSGTAHSPCIPDRLASGAFLGSFVCVLDLSPASRGPLGIKAALARSLFRRMSPRTPHTLVSVFPFSLCVKLGASPLHFFTSAWTCQLG